MVEHSNQETEIMYIIRRKVHKTNLTGVRAKGRWSKARHIGKFSFTSSFSFEKLRVMED